MICGSGLDHNLCLWGRSVAPESVRVVSNTTPLARSNFAKKNTYEIKASVCLNRTGVPAVLSAMVFKLVIEVDCHRGFSARRFRVDRGAFC